MSAAVLGVTAGESCCDGEAMALLFTRLAVIPYKCGLQARFELHKGAVMFTHTEVSPQFEGQGLGSKLAAFALDDVRKRGLQVIPVCQYIAGYIRKHPQYQDLLSEEQRRAFKI